LQGFVLLLLREIVPGRSIRDRWPLDAEHFGKQVVADQEGVTEEIDEIRGEVRAIQKHLGIERKIIA
jgi:hypothetical protein